MSFIWSDVHFPSHLHPFLIGILEKFEILHRLEGQGVDNMNLLIEANTPDKLATQTQILNSVKEGKFFEENVLFVTVS